MPRKLTHAEARAKLDADVAAAQASAIAPGKRETQAQRDARLDRDRAAVVERHELVAQAQVDEGNLARLALEGLTPEQRAELREAGRLEVLARQAAMDAAVLEENRRRAKVPADA